MSDSITWLLALGPLLLAFVSIVPGGSAALRGRAAMAAAAVTMAVALSMAATVAVHGPLATQTIGSGGIGFSLYLDNLSATMLCLVSFIGLIVVAYSRNYLAGDPGQRRFTRYLCITLASVLLVIVAGNGALFVCAWAAMSLSLHCLLVFYPERPAAVIAARKKFVASRLSELCTLGAMIAVYHAFGSLDYTTVFQDASDVRALGAAGPTLNVAALLFVAAALLISAQFPIHGWIVEVMETPTPVSALLHAGIINAGGFLILRFSEIIALSLPSLNTLAIVGGFTALFGSVVMLTQTSIKVTLAYSTIAQMGFMMLECGLAAFPAALLHIIAHSLYKAHAFLSSGSVIDIARASWTPSPGGKPHPARMLIAIVSVLIVAFAIGRVFRASLVEQPGVFVFGAVLMLGLIHLVANGIDERPNFYVVGRAVLFAGIVAVSYFALQIGVEVLAGSSLPKTQALRGPFELVIAGAVILSFAVVTFFQAVVPPAAHEPRWQAFYAYISNGLYVNTYANRLVLKYWPRPRRAGAAGAARLERGV